MNTPCTAPLRILLVEDDATLAMFLARALRRAGHFIEIQPRGDDGLSMMLAGDFDLLVLDWQLPGLDGLVVARAMRLAGSSAPVLMLSGNGEFRRAEALAAGVDEFLNKPCGMSELIEAVAALAARIPGLQAAHAA